MNLNTAFINGDWSFISASDVVAVAYTLHTMDNMDQVADSPEWAFLVKFCREWTTPTIGDVVEFVDTLAHHSRKDGFRGGMTRPQCDKLARDLVSFILDAFYL